MVLLSIDLGKAKSVACWYQSSDQTHDFRTVPTTPQAFHDLLTARAVDRKLNERGQADHRVIRLQTIPGVGPRLSEMVVAVIDDPKRFKNVRQVGAYVGLGPASSG